MIYINEEKYEPKHFSDGTLDMRIPIDLLVNKPVHIAWYFENNEELVTLIFITALLTGLGIFDRIAKYAGAGTLVPITGFANAVAAPAIDTKGEGFVLGVGTKILSIAGPVILYGTASGVLYGVIYWVMGFFVR